MNSLLVCAIVLLQSVVSIKPGFVDVADGDTNVRKYEHLSAGSTIRTGARGHVQIGLGVDALLRLDENSEAVLESVDGDDVGVRLQSGSALIEITDMEKSKAIRVAAGELKVLIDSKGVFRFSVNSVSVIDGRLRIEGSSVVVQKGWQAMRAGGSVRQSKLQLTTPEPFKSFLGSSKGGFINAVLGEANVRASTQADSDEAIQTGPASYVEVLLRAGAFMRIDENSSVGIDSSGINDVVVRVISGSMLIENVVSEPRLPLRVNVGGTKTIIETAGVYRFTSETAFVIEGVLRYGRKDESATAGTEVRIVDQRYQAHEVPDQVGQSAFDLWSAERSHMLARASFMSDYSDTYPGLFLFGSAIPYGAVWMYSPSIDAITVMPLHARQSYYGDTFVPLNTLVRTVPPLPRSSPPIPITTPAPSATPAPPGPPEPASPAPSTTKRLRW